MEKSALLRGLEGTPLGEYSKATEEKTAEKSPLITLPRTELRSLIDAGNSDAQKVLGRREELIAMSGSDLIQLAMIDTHAQLVLNARRRAEQNDHDPYTDLGYEQAA